MSLALFSFVSLVGVAHAALTPVTPAHEPNAQVSPVAASGRYAVIAFTGETADAIYSALTEIPETAGNHGQVLRVGKQLTCAKSNLGETNCQFHIRTNYFQIDGDNVGSLSALRRQDAQSVLAVPSPRANPYHWQTTTPLRISKISDSARVTTTLGRRIHALRLSELPAGDEAVPLPRNAFTCQIGQRTATGLASECVIYFDSMGKLGRLESLKATP